MPLPQPADLSGPEDIRTIQQDRLLWTMQQARRSPFYARLLAVPRRALATYHESSGTSGEPSPSYYTEADWVDLAERFARKSIGLSADDTLLVRAPYALPLTGHLAHAGGRLRGALVVPGDLRSTAMPYGRVVRVLHDLEVTVTWSLPTEMLLVAAAARVAGYQPGKDFPALRAILPRTRAFRSRAWAHADRAGHATAPATTRRPALCPATRRR